MEAQDASFSIIPNLGWKARLSKVFPQKRDQKLRATIRQIIPLIPLFLRYLIYSLKMWLQGRKPTMGFLSPAKNDQRSGVPLGGIGGGTIGRGFRGEFCNFQMMPGMYENTTVPADQFIVTIQNDQNETVYQKVLSVQNELERRHLLSWDWTFPGDHAEYTALYPRSWTSFNIPEHDIELICHQLSPVIPHNYQDSCVPAVVFEWIIMNHGKITKNISITFTMKNGTGSKWDSFGSSESKFFERTVENCVFQGITISQQIGGLPCSYNIGSKLKPDVSVTRCIYFNPKGDGKEIWDSLKETGELHSETSSYRTRKGEELGCAMCGKVELFTGITKTLTFALSWDMPKIYFPFGKNYYLRYYTRYFSADGNSGPDICSYSLSNYKRWEYDICSWQEKYTRNNGLPDWYKSALMNELYYISDGGTLWLLPDASELLPEGDPRLEFGRFAYLEGHEYRMYNTYDVHFYASFGLAMLWPHLQESLQYDVRDAIQRSDCSEMYYLYNGEIAPRKSKDTVPHDLGDPAEAPWELVNAYNIHNVAEWRDLNLKFVLQVYRDYTMNKNLQYLGDMYSQVNDVINYALKWDVDNDGMIENSGTPDQTYDAWTMKGTSAYCGSLWVATLYAAGEISYALGDFKTQKKYKDLLEKSTLSFENKLWNGWYYNFDSSDSRHSKSIMSDQLCGLWYLRSSSVENEVFPPAHVQTALKTIFKYNVEGYFGGTQGAVNGMMPNGEVDTFAIQSEEVWTGVSYALASLMIFEGLVKEGLATAKGIYETVYEKSGLGFATPEALHGLDSFRSIAYMRPLSIWSMQLALDMRKELLEKSS